MKWARTITKTWEESQCRKPGKCPERSGCPRGIMTRRDLLTFQGTPFGPPSKFSNGLHLGFRTLHLQSKNLNSFFSWPSPAAFEAGLVYMQLQNTASQPPEGSFSGRRLDQARGFSLGFQVLAESAARTMNGLEFLGNTLKARSAFTFSVFFFFFVSWDFFVLHSMLSL